MTAAAGLGPYIEPTHHYALLEHVLKTYRPSGTALEFGVATGTSTRIIAEHMPVIGFDVWTGLPEWWRPGFKKGKFAVAHPPNIPNVRLVTGLFAETLPFFDFDSVGEIGLVHMDADLYSSTAVALRYVGEYLRPGALLVFDEWHGFPGCEDYEQRAWREHVELTGTSYEVVGHSFEQIALRLT